MSPRGLKSFALPSLWVFAFAYLATAPSFASTPARSSLEVSLDQGSGRVEFNAIGRPSALKIKGVGEAPKGTLVLDQGKLSGSAVFSLGTLDTGIALRNRHMKEKYLETAKYPDAKVTFSKVELQAVDLTQPLAEKSVSFEGVLSLHGTEKPIQGKLQIASDGAMLSARAEFGLKISDFQIPSPGFAGITMAEDVQVIVESKAPIRTKAPQKSTPTNP